ncbi:MAG: phosphotransferase [Proteobacteria bacterium]|nr:phosphotransferase [Pseudomonadota bacterium]
MSGREPKPAWAEVPASLRAQIEALIGGNVARAEIVWGGYGPSATFLLSRASGETYFCKGTHPGQTRQGHEALIRERQNYEAFPELGRFGPHYLGGADEGDWHVAVLESVARSIHVPPWRADAAQSAIALIVAFHDASPERAGTDLRPSEDVSGLLYGEAGWASLIEAGPMRDGFLALFEDTQAAGDWLDRHGAALASISEKGAGIGGPRSWVHLDIRSDNLIFAADRVHLVDWPMLSFGPALLDIAFFLPSLAGEGGPDCNDGLKLYEAVRGIQFEHDDVVTASTVVAGFFAARAGGPPIPGLPRLRWVQKLQLFPALNWLCNVMGIESPPLPRPFEP